MKRAILATVGLAVAMVLGVTLMTTGTARASDPDNNDIIKITSPQNNTAVAVGSTFTFSLRVDQSTDPAAGYKAIQWEVAYPNNSSYVSATYNCTDPSGINFPAETETPPVESPLIPGTNNLGGGANCASLSGTFNGFHATGVFVTVTLMCNSVLSSTGGAGDAVVVRPQNEAANPANDTFFGTTLLDKDANVIDTALTPQIPIPGFGNQAAVTYSCAAPVDYVVSKTATAAVSGDAPNNLITTTISIKNPDSAAHATVLQDNLPGGVTGLTVPPGCLQTGPSQVTFGAPVGAPPTAAGATDTYTITYKATPAQDCGSLSNTVQGGPGDATTADSNLANNVATKVTAVDCPVLSVNKSTPTTSAFTDDNVTYTITVSNDGPATGSTAHNVVLNDATSAGMTFVSASPPCNPRFPCTLGDIPAGGTVVITLVEKMPSGPGNACDTASATQSAPGAGASSSQVCVTVKSKFPVINGIAKDTGITPLNPDGSPNNNFTFTVGNLFLCKALGSSNPNLPPVGGFSRAGETACGGFKIAEVGQTPKDLDTCNDDNDAEGEPCAGDASQPPSPYQDRSHDGKNTATDYHPGATAVG